MRTEVTPVRRVRVDGAAIVYRLFDIGYAIRLDDAMRRLAPNTAARARPSRSEAQAIQIANPPISVTLGVERIVVGATSYDAEISARLFDFGVCSLRIQCHAPVGIDWNDFADFGAAIDDPSLLSAHFERHLNMLLTRIAAAIDRPFTSPVTEDFVVFRLTSISERAADGRVTPLSIHALSDDDLARLLLQERRRLSDAAKRELLPRRFSYYDNDLTVLTWDNALVVDERAQDEDVQYILEFANAQLLELRVYDALLDAQLPAMYERIAAARTTRLPIFDRSVRQILAGLQTRVADITEPVERVENALKVTDDVYLARIYAAALDIFREREWRTGIDRKLTIIRDTYMMLNSETQTLRAELLEVAIVLLIVAELVLLIIQH